MNVISYIYRMCGITGILAFNEIGRMYMPNIQNATNSLTSRGPDDYGFYAKESVALGHRRLSIQDTTRNGHQPMSNESKRYTIVFNGEIYNFQALKNELEQKGINFQSNSDTEVLLQLYIHEKEKCLQKLNGFFSFAIYDIEENSLFIARDRFGIKPLIYYIDEDRFVFGSEMKAVNAFNVPKEINYESIFNYFQLSYVPQPNTCFKNVFKLEPGNYAIIKNKAITITPYYNLQYKPNNYTSLSYTDQQTKLIELLEESVEKRLISDVPLGCFLSGGIDSSVISTLASKQVSDLKTYSIGYKDEPFFDETKYAELVAKNIKSNHTTFKLTNDDLFNELDLVLESLDEPFGDSSALPVHLLSRLTRKDVTVALSGDGADEIFSGYNKHLGEFKAREKGGLSKMVELGLPLWKALPKSRNSSLSNKIRQFERFAEGLKLTPSERYWAWCKYNSEETTQGLFSTSILNNLDKEELKRSKDHSLRFFSEGGDFNEVLRTDVGLVLQSDMLTKVDLMSMSNSLEIRVPFLDHNIVDFAFSLPTESKIDGTIKKRILQDAFKSYLPEELYKRPKHGFEVPLLKWFRTDLKSKIENKWLNDDFIEEQGIFNTQYISSLKKKLHSSNPGDSHATIWMLIVFQNWWQKNFKEQ